MSEIHDVAGADRPDHRDAFATDVTREAVDRHGIGVPIIGSSDDAFLYMRRLREKGATESTSRESAK